MESSKEREDTKNPPHFHHFPSLPARLLRPFVLAQSICALQATTSACMVALQCPNEIVCDTMCNECAAFVCAIPCRRCHRGSTYCIYIALYKIWYWIFLFCRAYLGDVVEMVHIFFKMMEKFCNGRVVVQDKRRARKKPKGKSKKAPSQKKSAEEEHVSFFGRIRKSNGPAKYT